LTALRLQGAGSCAAASECRSGLYDRRTVCLFNVAITCGPKKQKAFLVIREGFACWP